MTGPRILFADALDAERLRALDAEGAEFSVEPHLEAGDLPGRIGEFDGLVVRSTKVTAETIESGRRLQFIVRAGAGVDNIDTTAASRAGVYVCNVPGRNAVAVAELTLGLLLAIDRRIPDNVADLRDGIWNKGRYSEADGIHGKNLAIVGLGSIGLEVARRAKAFGMTVTAIRKDDRGESTQSRIRSIGIRLAEDLPSLLSDADVVSVHVPNHPDTAGMVNAEFLSRLPTRAILLNTSRGEVVDEAALLVALDAGLRAGLDVFAGEPKAKEGTFDSPVARHPNVVGTHHIGASTEQAQRSVADGTVDTIRAFLQGRPVNVVNLEQEPTGVACLVVKHHDRVGVLASVLDELRANEINVQQMQNQLFDGDDGAAVATIHLGSRPEKALLDDLAGLPNVLDVGVIPTSAQPEEAP